MKDLPAKPTLSDYQNLVRQLVKQRGFDEETVPEVFMLLTEEIGEFAKAVRKTGAVKVATDSRVHEIEEEAADVFWLLVDLCNRLDIDLEQAFRAKEAKNQKRTWVNTQ